MSIEAMKQALEAIANSGDFLFNWHDCEPNNEREMSRYQEVLAMNEKAFTALRTAIEQAEKQEPVAWMDGYRNIYSLEEKAAGCEDAVIPLVPVIQHWSDCAVHNEPAYPKGVCDCGGYTNPPAAQRQWVGLTDDERKQLWYEWENGHVVEAAETKLREKNGGQA